jgi:integrase
MLNLDDDEYRRLVEAAADDSPSNYARRVLNERVWKGRRFCFSTKANDWDQAAAVRDLYEARKGIGSRLLSALEVPRFAEFGERYLREATGHLAATTLEDRVGLLRPEGPLTAYFGSYRLDDIRRATLLEWWHAEVEAKGLAQKTGKNRLDALSAVLGFAVDLELLEANPVDGFRATLRRRNRTQRGRAEGSPGATVRPIEDLEDLAAFVEASAAEGGDGHLVDLLQLDAGLRLGEALGLRWCDVWWGKDADDMTRALVIQKTRARGRHVGTTKSGRARRVALSRRLRSRLLERWMAAGRPTGPEQVLPGVDQSNYRSRHFADVCEAAKIGPRRPKDLRDTYASQLLTAGVQLGYVSQQLGHADVAVTARHYARWAGGDSYRIAVALRFGELPADCLARLAGVGPATGQSQR